MCATCGCTEVGHDHPPGPHHHGHDHDHPHLHSHPHDVMIDEPRRVVTLEAQLLAKNDARAASNRAWLAQRRVTALNLMSSPGAGKTTLLERTLREIGTHRPLAVIEGDQETSRDADRIHAAGAPALQINTGAGCHLDAEMVARGLEALRPAAGGLLFIENVGNLVCPALFDLGERARVVVASVTEGEDKPIKYPYMFRAADAVVLNKIDLVPHVSYELGRFQEHLQEVNSKARLFLTSATRGEGFDAWYAWIEAMAVEAATVALE